MSLVSHLIYLFLLSIEGILWYSAYTKEESMLWNTAATSFIFGVYWGRICSTYGRMDTK